MKDELSKELVERCVALVRRCANRARTTAEATIIGIEAEQIVALLTKPVDPDLIEARAIAADISDDSVFILKGYRDGTDMMRLAIAALKRGRALAREEQ